MFGIGMNLPIWEQRLDARVNEAKAHWKETVARAAQQRVDIEQERSASQIQVDRAAALLDLYRDRILPQAKQEVSAAEVTYQNGRGGLQAVLNAQRQLQVLRREQLHVLARLQQSRADLERANGLAVPSKGGQP